MMPSVYRSGNCVIRLAAINLRKSNIGCNQNIGKISYWCITVCPSVSLVAIVMHII